MARLLLKDLTPGTTYKIQVRSKTGDSVSEWSRLFDLPTTTDNIPPDVPAWAPSDEWVTSGDTFVATWQPLDFNLDQNKDFSHYEISITDGVTARTIRTTNTSYTLTFEQNRIYWGTPQATLSAKVRSVDFVGNTSAFNSLESATNPAPAASASISVTALYDSVKVDWDPVVDDDLKGYKLQVSTTSSSSGFTDIYNGPDLSYVYSTLAYLSDHWFRVYAVDKFGTLSSATTSGAIKPKSAFTVDTTPPNAPTSIVTTQGFDSTQQTSWVNIAWTASTSTDVNRYEVRYSTTAGTNWQYTSVGSDTTAARIEGLLPNTTYYVDVRAVDISGNVSAWVNQPANYPITTSADTTAPSQPAAPTAAVGTQKLQVIVSGLKQGGGNMEADVDYYEVFASTSTGFTTYDSTTMLGTIQKGPAMIETFQIPASAASGSSQTWYVKVRAVDRSGNISPASNQATAAVGLILTANISDLAVTDAKINTLTASKITAGTISAQTINIGSTGVLNVDSTGQIKSNNYVATSTGYKLDSAGLEINNGTIYAGGLKIRDGRNIMAAEYESFERQNINTNPYVFYKTGGAANTGAEQTPTIVTGGLSKFGSQHLRNQWTTTTTNPQALWMTPTSSTYNIDVEANVSYIISAYVWNTGAVNTAVQLGVAWATSGGAFISTTLSVAAQATINAGTAVGSAVRVSGVVTAPATAAKAAFIVQSSTMTNGAGYNIDGIQVEAQAGGAVTPSQWKSSGATIIENGIIRTSELRSSQNLTINDVTLPYWSISTTGAALFSDLAVRGNTVLGSPDEDTVTLDGSGNPLPTSIANAGSVIRSHNYSTGSSGWAIYSNGIAEFRSVVAGSFDGGAIAPGTMSADTFVSKSTLTNEIVVTGSLHTIGEMGEDIGITSEGFRVLGAYQVPVTHRSITSDVVTLTTITDHGFVVPYLDTDGVTMIRNKLFVTGLGAPYDGTWVINSVTANTVSYVLSSSTANVTTEPVIGGLVKSKSTSKDIEQPRLIYFPTDGSQPNIVSGTLSADSLTVSTRASFRGEATVDNGTLTIASGVLAPKSQPVAVSSYRTVSLTGSTYENGAGLTIGHTGNFFVLHSDSSKMYVKEFNSTTGAYIATRLERSLTEGRFIYTANLWESKTFIPRGIVYSSKYNKYYIGLTKLASLSGGRPVPGEDIGRDRHENIETYDTSFSSAVEYTTASDPNDDAGWGYGGLGMDYTVAANGDKLVRTVHVDGSGTRWSDITLNASGFPASNTGYSTISSTLSSGNTGNFVMRVDDIDGVSATRLIVKDKRGTAGKAGYYWAPFNTSNTLQTNEQWEAANNLTTLGAYYNTTEKAIYALNVNGVIKYESDDSYWSTSGITSQRWVGYSWYDSQAAITANVSTKAASGTTATLTTSSAHGLVSGDVGKWVEVRGVDSTFNGHWKIASVPNTTQITYTLPATTTVSSTASSGTIKKGVYETQLSPIASVLLKKRALMNVTVGVIPYSASGEYPDKARVYVAAGTSMPTLTGTVSTSWHLRETITTPDNSTLVIPAASPNGDRPLNTVTNTFTEVNAPSVIQSSTGNSYWKGDDTAQFYQLVLNSSTDVNTSAGNKPPLRIGDIAGTHLRVDGNEIVAMTGDTTQGVLNLNIGGQTYVGATSGSLRVGTSGTPIMSVYPGHFTGTTNGSGELTVDNFTTQPDANYIVVPTMRTSTARTANVLSRSTASFVLQIRSTADGSLVTSTSVAVSYIIIAT